MICTGVMPCLSSGLAKNKLMFMFVIFLGFVVHFKSLAFFRKWRGGGGGGKP